MVHRRALNLVVFCLSGVAWKLTSGAIAEIITGPGCSVEATRSRPSSLSPSLNVRGLGGDASANGSRALLSYAGEGFAGLLDGASRGCGNCPAVLNDVLQALANQFTLDRDELLDRPGT